MTLNYPMSLFGVVMVDISTIHMCQFLVQDFEVVVLDGLFVLEPSLPRGKYACNNVTILTENSTKINVLQWLFLKKW